MTASALSRLRAERAFQPLRTFEELPVYHVAFDDIRGDDHHEARLADALAARRRATVVGRRGSGKSSLIAAVAGMFGPLPERFVPVRVAVATAADEVVTDPGEFARLVTRLVAAGIAQLGDDERTAARRRTADSIRLTHRPTRFSGGIGVPGDIARLQVDVRAIETEYTLTASGPELIAAASDLFRTIRAHGVEPVLILDDSDSWFAERAELAVTFFERTLRPVAPELACPIVAAVHDEYRTLAGMDDALRALFSDEVEIPRLTPDEARMAIAAVVERAVAVHDASDADPFEGVALDVLAAAYVEHALEMRDLQRILDHAVGVACDLEADRVDERIMRQAAIDERP